MPPTMPRFVFERTTLTRESRPTVSSNERTTLSVDELSTMIHSHSGQVWPKTLAIVSLKIAEGGLYTGVIIEMVSLAVGLTRRLLRETWTCSHVS